MDNVLSYVNFRGDLSFGFSPFNEIDAAALAILSGLDMSGLMQEKITLCEAAKLYKARDERDTRDERIADKEALLYAMADSRRFKDVRILDYTKDIDGEAEKTFYGVTFEISRFFMFIAFRGTDGTLMSWKENFNCIYTMPTSGQLEALDYITRQLAGKRFVKCSVAGHSKGGNLATYATVFADEKIRKKIKHVYVFDAPGFIDDITKEAGYADFSAKLSAYVPESCFIGNLMNPPYERVVVKGMGKGVYQHDLFNWSILRTKFETVEETDKFSIELSDTVNRWIEGIPVNSRKTVVEELFEVFKKNGILHISALMHLDIKTTIGLLMSVKSLSKENRELLGIIIKQLKFH